MELYNEEVRDLLIDDSNATQSLPIQEDRRGNVQIPGLIERIVFNIEELMNVVHIAEGNRTIGSTAMNERSSRSHTIFRITYEKREVMVAGLLSHDDDVSSKEGKENDISGGNGTSNNSRTANSSQKVITTVSNLNLVDLAGSESVRVTGATGDRQKEGGKINQSLLTLSTVLSKLGKKDGGHINYRDSKLTRILKPSLSGNARMGCICCISPDVKYIEESKSTLDFATRTMLVTTNAKSNMKVDYDDSLVKEFEMEIERIKNETAKSEASRLQMEDEIVCLKANLELAIGKATRVKRENNELATRLEELQASNENDRNNLLKEICMLKSRNHELETKLFDSESEKSILAKRQEDDCKSTIQKQKQIESLQFTMEEKEHELQLLRNDNTKSISKLTDQISELERLNNDLREQLATAVNKSSSSCLEDSAVTSLTSTISAVTSLTSTIDSLTREKLHLETRLAREIEKSTARRMEAKERRQKFKGKLAGMAETLKDGK
jgi:centromeric protein E